MQRDTQLFYSYDVSTFDSFETLVLSKLENIFQVVKFNDHPLARINVNNFISQCTVIRDLPQLSNNNFVIVGLLDIFEHD